MSNSERVRAEKRGRRAEDMAALWLQLKGYKILARRFKTKLGEIDLIAKRKNIVAIIEVKQRKDLDSARASLQPQSLQRIERAAEQFIQRRRHLAQCDLRFDAVFVLPGLRIKHIADAWRAY